MVLMFVSPQNSYVEILMPNVIVLGNGALLRYLGYQGGIFINGISVLISKTPQSRVAPYLLLPCEDASSL